jgi:hypothetical protein
MKWGKHETYLLRNNLTLPNAELARRLKRTEISVKCKKNRMGLSAAHPRWSPEDVRILNMGFIPAGRTPEACRRRRRRMANAREK